MQKMRSNKLHIILFLLPALILFLGILIAPIIMSGYYSFFDWNGFGDKLFIGFENYKEISFLHDDFSLDIPIISAEESVYSIAPEEDIFIFTEADAIVKARFELPRLVFAGGIEGEKAGVIKVFVNGKLAEEENLVYTDNVNRDLSQKLSLFERIEHLINRVIKPYYING